MARTVNEVMTADPRTVTPDDSLVEAARHMRDGDVGAVVVIREGDVAGVLTDRDIVVRGVAQGLDVAQGTVGEVASQESVVTVTPDQTIDEATRLMTEHDVRRLVVVQGGRPAGILSLGDLSLYTDVGDETADISTASPNR